MIFVVVILVYVVVVVVVVFVISVVVILLVLVVDALDTSLSGYLTRQSTAVSRVVGVFIIVVVVVVEVFVIVVVVPKNKNKYKNKNIKTIMSMIETLMRCACTGCLSARQLLPKHQGSQSPAHQELSIVTTCPG